MSGLPCDHWAFWDVLTSNEWKQVFYSWCLLVLLTCSGPLSHLCWWQGADLDWSSVFQHLLIKVTREGWVIRRNEGREQRTEGPELKEAGAAFIECPVGSFYQSMNSLDPCHSPEKWVSFLLTRNLKLTEKLNNLFTNSECPSFLIVPCHLEAASSLFMW